MTRLKLLISFSILLAILLGCEDKKEEHYKRPEWLAGAIYQQLEAEGRFTSFISLLDYMGYDEILGKTGYFTLFAPNDSAFQVFLQARGLTLATELDTALIRDIVQYALVENGYTPHTLAAYQSSNGWVEGKAFRRMTRSSKKYYKATVPDPLLGQVEAYVKNDGVKFITYFLDEFFITSGIPSANYNFFYPDVQYTGFNVLDAKVKGGAIIAENGYIYELDKVILPLPNLDEYFDEHPQKENFSTFKVLLSKVAEYEIDTSDHSKELPVYFKTYDGIVPDPNIEQYSTSNIYQTECFSMFVPDNTTLQEFYTNKFLKYFTTLDNMVAKRPEVVTDFINAHMFSTVWPSEIDSSEYIISKMIASNGFFYGTNAILNTGNIFNSVYSEICLNPNHNNFYLGINNIEANKSLKNLLTSEEIDYTLFLTTDDIFDDDGFFYSPDLLDFYPLGGQGAVKVTRFINNMIVRGDYDDLSGKGFLKTYGGDIIKYDNNVLWGGGNIEGNVPANIIETNKEPNNGTVYKIGKNILPPAKTYIEILQSPPTGASYTQFNLYLTNSGLVSQGVIAGTSAEKGMTILVPTDDAITAAGLPAFNTTDSVSKAKIKNFILYHIIQDAKYPEAGSYKTYNVTSVVGKFDVNRTIITSAVPGAFEITDGLGNKAAILNTAHSCNFSVEGACIYQIDKVLKYE